MIDCYCTSAYELRGRCRQKIKKKEINEVIVNGQASRGKELVSVSNPISSSFSFHKHYRKC